MQRITVALVTLLAVLTLATPSHATLNACSAAKKKCVAKKAAALLKCHAKNEKPPVGLTPASFAACIQKAKDKFDGGLDPAKGCFAKLEAKFPGGCLTISDTVPLEGKVDAFVDDVVCELDPGSGTCPPTPTPGAPTPTPTSTPAGCNANGQSCTGNFQCCSFVCMFNTCLAPTCNDGIQNGNETGVDCGGSCPACQLGQGCSTNTDCQATTTCSGGTCVCAAGQSDCNGLLGDGCEVNTASDPNNCGACGSVCSLPNANSGCTAAQCTIASCNTGYTDCDGLTGDGCEINTTGDNNNCGFCGLTCPFPQNCVNSICQ
jgi:hypothetical protein